MSSGHYPFDSERSEAGKRLAKIADDLSSLLASRGTWGQNALPAAYENDTPDDAAADGACEAYLNLALELIERCIERPKVQP